MIYIAPSDKAHFSMRIFNADGSEASMCGNGIRCVGKYVFEKGYTDKTEITVDTLAGIKTLHLDVKAGKVETVSVEMGTAAVEAETQVEAAGQTVSLTPVDVGNPHAVIFCEDAESAPVAAIGSAIEHHERFPGGVNVEFVSLLKPNTLCMRVWERGSGITMACGTGACASVAAAVKKGLVAPGTEIEVVLDGGSLYITVDTNNAILMRGSAAFVYEGEI